MDLLDRDGAEAGGPALPSGRARGADRPPDIAVRGLNARYPRAGEGVQYTLFLVLVQPRGRAG